MYKRFDTPFSTQKQELRVTQPFLAEAHISLRETESPKRICKKSRRRALSIEVAVEREKLLKVRKYFYREAWESVQQYGQTFAHRCCVLQRHDSDVLPLTIWMARYLQTKLEGDGTLPILEVHTPISSFAIQHSLARESLQIMFDKLSRKANTGAEGARVGPGWVKYEWNDVIWNLDDDSDYIIFLWRQQAPSPLSTSSASPPPPTATPTIHLRNPATALPGPSEYRNASFYLFRPNAASSLSLISPKSRAKSIKSSRSKGSGSSLDDGVPQHKKDFMKFHSENGVRTVTGKVGPVEGIRMLLKTGYRHVYMSRSFAMKHGFIPSDAAPGHYGYGGLVNIGQWPLTLGSTTTTHTVFLSEETHFDVILGRAFMERRGIKTDPLDLTSVVCLDTGEKLDCEVVVIRDGKGEIVTVT